MEFSAVALCVLGGGMILAGFRSILREHKGKRMAFSWFLPVGLLVLLSGLVEWFVPGFLGF